MPLNINLQQILLHLFNFTLLFGGLYFLLYKPVKSFMDNRSADYESKEKAIEDKMALAKAIEEKYNGMIESAEKDIADKKAEALNSAEKAAEERIAKAKAEEERIIADAKARAEREKKRVIEESREEIIELAAQMAEKVLHGEDIS